MWAMGYGLWSMAGGAGKISTEPLLNTPFSPFPNKTRKNAIVEYLDYQIPVTQLYGDMQAAKRD